MLSLVAGGFPWGCHVPVCVALALGPPAAGHRRQDGSRRIGQQGGLLRTLLPGIPGDGGGRSVMEVM